jgi:hypothetical protein
MMVVIFSAVMIASTMFMMVVSATVSASAPKATLQ